MSYAGQEVGYTLPNFDRNSDLKFCHCYFCCSAWQFVPFRFVTQLTACNGYLYFQLWLIPSINSIRLEFNQCLLWQLVSYTIEKQTVINPSPICFTALQKHTDPVRILMTLTQISELLPFLFVNVSPFSPNLASPTIFTLSLSYVRIICTLSALIMKGRFYNTIRLFNFLAIQEILIDLRERLRFSKSINWYQTVTYSEIKAK